MKTCSECGEHVSDSYFRVFGRDDGSLLSCPGCGRHVIIDRTLRAPGSFVDVDGGFNQ